MALLQHILWHVYNSTEPCGSCLPENAPLSGHWFSADGHTWNVSDTQPYSNVVHTTDGKQLRLSTLERPKLMFDDSGEITHLITGVCPQHSCAPTAAAALGRSAPRLPEDDGKSYEVFSASAGGWVPCKVEERDEDQVRVSYESQVRLPTLHIDLMVCLDYL